MFLLIYRETSDIGWLAVPSGLTTASSLELECSTVGLRYFQCYLALLQNFACKYTVPTVMFLNYCCDELSFLKLGAISQSASDTTATSPASNSLLILVMFLLLARITPDSYLGIRKQMNLNKRSKAKTGISCLG